MKFLVFFLMMFPVLASADMGGVNVGFGEGTRPFYGLDYEFNKGLPYLDVSLTGNQDYLQPGVSGGLQFEHINVGVATAVVLLNMSNGAFNGQLLVGPEVGYMYNLTRLVYVKENNQYMGFDGKYNFSSTLSLGFNF